MKARLRNLVEPDGAQRYRLDAKPLHVEVANDDVGLDEPVAADRVEGLRSILGLIVEKTIRGDLIRRLPHFTGFAPTGRIVA